MVASIFCASVALASDFALDRRRTPPEPDWRAAALRNMRLATGDVILHPAGFPLYRDAGFNTVMVYDADTFDPARSVWNFKSEDEIRTTTTFARANHVPLIVGLSVQPYDSIPQATDDEIRGRLALWYSYGDDVILGVSPWYDDVFYDHVAVERQRHVYALIKAVAPDWFVFGIIGEFGFNATDEEIAASYDPAAFDQLAVLMYPFNVGAQVTGFPLDNVASPDPDGDITRYVDRFLGRMNEKFFAALHPGQLIVLVVQAFYYPTDPTGHIPRAEDVRIMVEHGNDTLRVLRGQTRNASIAYCCWGGNGEPFVGMADRPDWVIAARDNARDVRSR